jgi:hypothetical protein
LISKQRNQIKDLTQETALLKNQIEKIIQQINDKQNP